MNFGIIGTGMIATFHARALAEMEGSRLVACLDTVPSRAENFAAAVRAAGNGAAGDGAAGNGAAGNGSADNCAAYSDMEAFLAHPGLEIVTVCTPSGAHLEAAVAAAQAGKHVVVEKPLEITTERCDAMIEACGKAGVVLSGIFPSRFHDTSRAIKAAVDEGRFGRLTMGNAYVKWWRDQAYYDMGAWKGTIALDGGGALMNQSIHAVDLLSWFMGPVTEVLGRTARIGHERIEVEDCAAAVLRFENGAMGVIQGSTAVWPGFLKRIEVSGLSGSAIMDEEDLSFWQFRDEIPADAELRARLAGGTHTGGGASDPGAIGHHGHRLQFEDVVAAIREGRQPLVDGREARKSVAIIRAIYESAASGVPAIPAM